MKCESQCEGCNAAMKFDEGHYLEVLIVQQGPPSPFDMLGGLTPESEHKGGESFEGYVAPMYQQPMARLLCPRCDAFLEITEDMREQARIRAMAWWRDMLPNEAVRLETRPCGFCGGKGNQGRMPCQLCGRSGTVVVRSPAKKCATCNGTGKGLMSMHFGVGGTCSFCKGLGWQFDRRGEIRQEEDTAKQQRRSAARS